MNEKYLIIIEGFLVGVLEVVGGDNLEVGVQVGPGLGRGAPPTS